jgi:predicted metal-dependent HD superfamily phosphohydrolase
MKQLLAHAPAGLVIPSSLLAVVHQAYASPGRAYHDLSHIYEVAMRFAEADRDVGFERPREIYLAVLFHDAVYAAGAPDNEVKSAALARAAMAQHMPNAGLDGDRVAELIGLTAHHGRLTSADVDADAALFLDCDMAILAASTGVFDAYERAIATEYSELPRAIYVQGRRAFLERLLQSPHIYLSPYGQGRFESAARENLSRTLATTS